MKAGWRLTLNIAAWALAIPILGVTGFALSRSMSRTGQAEQLIGYAIELLLLVWAALIYRHCVPTSHVLIRRTIYLVVFVAAMVVIGEAAWYAAVLLNALLFGV
ncbi:hypothetical protein ACSFA0_02385 [Variovorax sp. LT1P1]